MGIAHTIAPHRKYLPEILPQDFEDILLVLTFFMVLFALYPSVLVIIWVVRYLRRKTWTIKGLFLGLMKVIFKGLKYLWNKIKVALLKKQTKNEFDL